MSFFNPADHPRGNPQNSGAFSAKSGSAPEEPIDRQVKFGLGSQGGLPQQIWTGNAHFNREYAAAMDQFQTPAVLGVLASARPDHDPHGFILLAVVRNPAASSAHIDAAASHPSHRLREVVIGCPRASDQTVNRIRTEERDRARAAQDRAESLGQDSGAGDDAELIYSCDRLVFLASSELRKRNGDTPFY